MDFVEGGSLADLIAACGPLPEEQVLGWAVRRAHAGRPRWDFVEGPSATYVTDTYPCTAALEMARGCTLLIHEASFSAVLRPEVDPARYFRRTVRQAGEVAGAADGQRLALVHLGPGIGERSDVLVRKHTPTALCR